MPDKLNFRNSFTSGTAPGLDLPPSGTKQLHPVNSALRSLRLFQVLELGKPKQIKETEEHHTEAGGVPGPRTMGKTQLGLSKAEAHQVLPPASRERFILWFSFN